MKKKLVETVGYIINGFSIALFFFLTFTLDGPYVFNPLRLLAWIFLGLGALLTLSSIVTLVINKKSELIDWGIYSLVRHPMYLGAIVFFLSWIFFFPNWIIILISFVNIVIVYCFILQGDNQNIIKFGSSYRHYMDTVPGINLFSGILRCLKKK